MWQKTQLRKVEESPPPRNAAGTKTTSFLEMNESLTPPKSSLEWGPMKSFLPQLRLAYMFQFLLLFLACFATGKLGLALNPVNTFATFIWLPTGIALAALTLYGYRLWPAVALAAFFINFSVGATPLVALGIAFGNTLEALFGAYLMRERVGINPYLSKLRDVAGLLGLAGPFPTLISATIGAGVLVFSNTIPASAFALTWLAWWIGNMLSVLTVAPFLLRWLVKIVFVKTGKEILEGLGIFTFLIAVNLITFWGPLGSGPYNSPLLYLVFLPLIWAALRAGPRGTTLGIFLTAFIAATGTLAGHGPFATSDPTNSLFLLQIFVGMTSLTFLLFTSAVEERKDALNGAKEYVTKLEQAFLRINSADQAKNDFLAILAHELRNPLAPVMSSIELLKLEGSENPRTQELFGILDKQVGNISRLLDDLLDISRITKKKFRLRKEILDVSHVVEQAATSVENFMKSRSHSFTVALPAEPLYVDADPLRLEQIMVNLLNNAGKYTQLGGKIVLEVKAEKHNVVVVVKDNGIGIPAEMTSKIFEPFIQLKSSASRSFGRGTGLGIGLSLTKRLVELHRGSIEVESKGEGQGSVFRVLLPRASSGPVPKLPAQSALTLPQSETDGRSEKRRRQNRILVVDDNADAARGLSILLRHKGHEVEIAYDGPTALSMVDSFQPSAVVLDIGLPEMDGYEVARRIREEHGENVRLIALTGYGLEEDKLRARMAGFDHHLTKPIGVADLEKVLP